MESGLIFESKKYISAKSAGQLTGYATDYIGQLARAKKIDARRIGRSWFIEKDSILNYKNFSDDLENKTNLGKERPVLKVSRIAEIVPVFRGVSEIWFEFDTNLTKSLLPLALALVMTVGVMGVERNVIGLSNTRALVAATVEVDTSFVDRAGLVVYHAISGLFQKSAPAVVLKSEPTFPIASTTSDNPVKIAVSAPVKTSERVIEKTTILKTIINTLPSEVSKAYLDKRLQELSDNVSSQFSHLSTGTGGAITNIYQQIAQSQKIDSLSGTIISNPTITGGSISGTSVTTGSLTISGTGTSTFPNGINVTGGCFSVNGNCISSSGGGGSVDTSLPNTWTALQQFNANASTTMLSVYGGGYFGGIGGGATTTILGNATSTFGAGISATYLNITGTSATSTFARGIDLAGGCFSVNGTCVGSGSSGTVTSVALSDAGSTLTIGGTPITTSGTLTATLNLSHANTWTALQTFNYSSSTIYSSFATASTTNLIVNGSSFNNLLGSGLSLSSGALTLDRTGAWTGTFDGLEGTAYLDRANHTGTQNVTTLSNYDWTFGTTYGVANLTSTSTKPLWVQGGLNASSTSHFNFASTTALNIGSDFITDINGTGLSLSAGGVLSVDCVAVTGSAALCDGDDAVGVAGTIIVSTSTNETVGQIPYWTTTSGTPAKLGSVATTTPTIGGSLSYSGTFGNVIGGVSGTLSLNLANANTFTALQQFNRNASTTQLSAYSAYIGGTATTTFTNAGYVGVASSTPWGLLSVNPNALGNVPEFVIGSSSATHFVVDGGGNVGIGTNSPGRKLQVTQVADTAYPTLGVAKGAMFLSSDTNLYGLYTGINTSSGNAWMQAMRNDNATAYHIILQPTAGNVGIRQTDPAVSLDVSGVDGTTSYIVSKLGSGVSGYGAYQQFSDNFTYNFSIGTAPTTGDFTFNAARYPTVAGTEVMRLTQGGLVGIGVTPASTLDIGATTGASIFNLRALTGTNSVYQTFNNTGGHFYVGMDNSAGTAIGTLAYAGSIWHEGNYPLQFGTNNTSRMVILASGNVGISTTTPFGRFSVNPIAGDSVGFVVGSSTATQLSVSSIGFGTTTLSGLNIAGQATSTSNVGLNITNGCFAISGTCVSGGGGSGTVTSVGLSVPTGFTVSNSPVTTSGTLALGISMSANGIVTVNSTGNGFVATTSQLTVGSLLATTTATSQIWGNVGISTTTPWAQFAINPIAGQASNQFVIGSSTATSFIINNTGTVGIATTTPSNNYALSVTGKGYFSTGLTLGTALTVDSGGTGAATFTSNGVLYGNGTSAFQVTTQGVANSILTANAGAPAFSASPTIGTSVTVPLVIGGTGASSVLSLQSTSGTGTSDAIKFLVGSNGGTEVGRMTSAGFFGMGTTTPFAQLQIATTSANAGFKPQLVLTDSNAPLNGKHWYIDSMSGIFDVGTTSDSGTYATSSAFSISAPTAASPGTTLGIATTSPWRTLSVTGTVGFDGLTTNTGAATASVCLSSTNEITKNTDNETCVASSIRYKKNVETLTLGLPELMQLKPVSFEYKAVPGTHFGLIAEDVSEINPLLVSVDDGGLPNGIRWTHVQALTINAIQEMNLNLESIASTTTATSTPVSQAFVKSFFDNLFARITTWLADATNGIENIFVKKVTTNTLCVSDDNGTKTCITKTQLDSLLANTGSSGNSGGNSTSTPDTTSPVITILGNNPATVSVGATYSDMGATVTDTNADGSVNNNLGLHFSVDGANVNDISLDTSSSTTHTVIYSAVDGAGNWGYATRTVDVIIP